MASVAVHHEEDRNRVELTKNSLIGELPQSSSEKKRGTCAVTKKARPRKLLRLKGVNLWIKMTV